MTIGSPEIKLKDGFLVCTGVPDQREHQPDTWCSDVQAFIKQGHDGNSIQPGDMIQVPIFPAYDIWCQVDISQTTYGPASPMSMAYMPDFGPEVKAELGFYNAGEGRWSIRSVIIDYIQARVHPDESLDVSVTTIKTKCPSNTHTFEAQKAMVQNTSPNWKWVCLWNIVMEKACTTCCTSASPDDDNNGLAGVNTGFRRQGRN